MAENIGNNGCSQRDSAEHKGYIGEKYVTPNGFTLGRWCTVQRRKGKKGTVSEQLRRELDSLGFVWDKNEYHWNLMYSLAKKYYEDHGERPGNHYVCNDGTRLGAWVTQAKCYVRGSKGEVDPAKKHMLEKIGIA